jgi:hypothetical protein
MKTKTFDLAISKVNKLPKAVQEQLGREVLLRIQTLEQLRAAFQVGIDELDADQGAEIDIDEIIAEARRQHGEGA